MLEEAREHNHQPGVVKATAARGATVSVMQATAARGETVSVMQAAVTRGATVGGKGSDSAQYLVY